MKPADASLHPEREHRQVAAVGEQLERAHLGDLPGQVQRHVLAGLLDLPVALEAEAQEVVVLRDTLAPDREKFSANVGISPPR